ncbi:MAG: AfsR/SARP family transcriptional regulator [Acidimicrobiales bacterium]
MNAGLEVRVLGALEVRRGGEMVPIGGPNPRLIVAMLVAAHGEVVSADRFCEEIWGDGQPADPPAVLQGNLSRLRRLLHPEARILARPAGYLLEIHEDAVDAWRFVAQCNLARTAADSAAVVDAYQRALACWHGPAYNEFAERDWFRSEVLRLEEMRTVAREELLSARLALGEDRSIVAELEALVSEHPLRERPWHELAVALHRSGRSADALRRIAAFRSILRDELGLDPPASIRQLESQILGSDPALMSAETPRERDADGPFAGPRSRRPPAEVTTLVGRGADLAGIVQQLGSQRLVTLVGPGGVGKTRLAMRVAADVWDQRRGEVFIVELAAVHDPLSTVASVATAVDVQQRQYLSVEESLVQYLRGRQALLVLDNCEHLQVAVAHLTERILSACPDLTVLATSRSVLGLPGEHVRRVEPLEVATEATSAAELGQVPAIRLFVDRAVSSNPDFSLNDSNAVAVADIVGRLEGLPLAIELAAARSSAIGPAAMAERLRHRFELLDHAQRGRSERHQTLTELVAWSFNLLDGTEQILFGRVSVFAGSFGLDAVEVICADESLDASSAARVLAALVDKSMVQLTDAEASRYRMLEPMRQFGYGELRQSERAAVAERHAAWYLSFAQRAARSMGGVDEPQASAQLDREFDNLRTAFWSFIERGGVEQGAELVVALREYSFRSMRAEAIGWAEVVINMAGFDVSPHSPLVLATAAYGRFVRGDVEGSIEYGNRAVAASERLGVGSSGLAERALANSWFYRGEADIAQQWIDRMLDDARRGGSLARLAHALYMRSVACTSVGDPDRGAAFADEAFSTARRCGSPTAHAQALYALGLSLEGTDPMAAMEQLQRAAELGAHAGNRWIQAFALTEVRWLQARQGHSRQALAGYAAVIELWFRGGDWANQWLSLRHVFGILVQLGDHRAAATLHGALTATGAAYALPFAVSDAERIDQLVLQLREEMGAPDFAAAVRRGTSMSDGEIIEFVQERIGALA